ncbi:MAG: hypothetical protein PHF29_07435 [Candidatus Riflebacteria bacterium]|nr:hypothetical protein [Candidatus Riflebacteria bacterium]
MNEEKIITDSVKWLSERLAIHSCYGKNVLASNNLSCYKTKNSLESAYDEIEYLLNIFKCDKDVFGKLSRVFMSLRNIEGTLKNLRAGLVLDETELLELKNFSLQVADVLKICHEHSISFKRIILSDLSRVIMLLNPDKTVVLSFYIHDLYSEKLKEIRTEKKKVEYEILRCAIPAEKEKLREQRALLVQQERDEELEVRFNLSKELRSYVEDLASDCHALGQLEFVSAKAELALRYGCVRPIIGKKGCNVLLVGGINPELCEILEKDGRSFTAVDVETGVGATLLTGANMGGKTVALTTIALNIELAMLGMFVFAKSLVLPMFDFIFVMGGDSQDKSFGLSSFGSEIVKLDSLISRLNGGRGFVVCDEFARSTNPFEGKRFVQALIDYMNDSDSYGIISTHYDGIKNKGYCYQVAGLKNIENKLEIKNAESLFKYMDYRLIRVTDSKKVPKEALNIAKMLNLSSEFLKKIENYYKL